MALLSTDTTTTDPSARANLHRIGYTGLASETFSTPQKVLVADELLRWLAKFGQVDKWKFCLRAARMPLIRSDNDKTSTPDTCPGLQGEGGLGCHQRREDAGRVTAYRRLVGTGIAAVSEEASGILSSDTV